MGSTSGISEQAAVSRDDNHQPAGEPDGLLPYSSAGNAVPPHCVPYGCDISRRIRHARIKKNEKMKKKKTHGASWKTQNCIKSPTERTTKSTVCAQSIPDHKLHPTSFAFQ